MQLTIGLIALLIIAGCSSIPFEETSYVPLDSEDPAAVIERYRNNIPEHIQLMHAVVFEYNGKKLSCLGFIEVDTGKKTYAVACLSPIGMKLFELTGDSKGVENSFVPGEFMRKEALVDMIGEDIKRIYFDLVPSSAARTKRKKHELVFRHKSGEGTIEHVFAGEGGYLIKKSYYVDNRLKWKVSYYEYKREDSGVYPGGIILNNYLYGYSVTLRLKGILN